MRAGVLISALTHVVVVLLALLGTPKLFDSEPLASVEVELVREQDVPQPQPEPKPEPERKKDDNSWSIPSAPPAAAASAAPTPPTPKSSQQQATLDPEKPKASGAQPSSGEAKQDEQPPKAAPSIFDPANIPALMELPNAPAKGFDAEATTMANLTADERSAFKSHLRKCWKLQNASALSTTTRVVLRLYLRRDARLASDPVLIEARSPRDAKVLMDTAISAIKECQPFAFLPADKYGEWKVLDLSFTPRDLAGG